MKFRRGFLSSFRFLMLKKVFYCLVVLVGCQGCSFLNFMKVTKALQLEYVTQSSFKREISFLYPNRSVVIAVTIANKTRYFLIDSGAGTIISKNLANEISYTSLGSTKYSDASGKKKKLKNIQVKEIEIEGITFNNVVASVADFNTLSKAYPCFELEISGIIGYNILNKAVWDFNFLKQKITLTDVFVPTNKTNQYLPLDPTTRMRPVLDLSVAEKPMGRAMIDLGSNASLRVSDRFFDETTDKTDVKTVRGNRSTFNAKRSIVKVKQATSTNVKLAGQKMEVAQLSFESNLSQSTIGTRFLENYRMVLDGPGHRLILSDYHSLTPVKKNTLGFTLSLYNTDLRVSSIIEESPAFKADLRVNDKILKINDTELSALTPEAYCAYLKQAIHTQDSLMIKVERAGGMLNKRLTKH